MNKVHITESVSSEELEGSFQSLLELQHKIKCSYWTSTFVKQK